MFDPAPGATGAALEMIRGLLGDLEAQDMLAGATARELAARIAAAESLEAALEGAGHVQENAPEDLATKRALFAALVEAIGQRNGVHRPGA